MDIRYYVSMMGFLAARKKIMFILRCQEDCLNRHITFDLFEGLKTYNGRSTRKAMLLLFLIDGLLDAVSFVFIITIALVIQEICTGR